MGVIKGDTRSLDYIAEIIFGNSPSSSFKDGS